MTSKLFIVRLAYEGYSIIFPAVTAKDADDAAEQAVKAAERETAKTGFVLDGPVEEV